MSRGCCESGAEHVLSPGRTSTPLCDTLIAGATARAALARAGAAARWCSINCPNSGGRSARRREPEVPRPGRPLRSDPTVMRPLFDAFHQRYAAALASRGVSLLRQPSETLEPSGLTRSAYSRGSHRLRAKQDHPDTDHGHMNAELWRSRSDRVLRHGRPPASHVRPSGSREARRDRRAAKREAAATQAAAPIALSFSTALGSDARPARNPATEAEAATFPRTPVSSRAPTGAAALPTARPWTQATSTEPASRSRETTRIATAGSCFAQHVGRALRGAGFTVLDAEKAPSNVTGRRARRARLSASSPAATATSTPPASWRNSSTKPKAGSSRRCLSGRRTVASSTPSAPGSIRAGSKARPRLLARRTEHLVGAARPVSRGRRLRIHLRPDRGVDPPRDPEPYTRPRRARSPAPTTLRSSPSATTTPPRWSPTSSASATALKAINPDARFLVTVSPVPLTATASGEHVEVATCYSKAVLRAACGMLVARHPDVDYFPSFEIITSQTARARLLRTEPAQRLAGRRRDRHARLPRGARRRSCRKRSRPNGRSGSGAAKRAIARPRAPARSLRGRAARRLRPLTPRHGEPPMPWNRDQMAARAAQGARGRHVRQPRHRHPDAGGELHPRGRRRDAAVRERHARHRPVPDRERGRPRPDQRRQADDHRARPHQSTSTAPPRSA